MSLGIPLKNCIIRNTPEIFPKDGKIIAQIFKLKFKFIMFSNCGVVNTIPGTTIADRKNANNIFLHLNSRKVNANAPSEAMIKYKIV